MLLKSRHRYSSTKIILCTNNFESSIYGAPVEAHLHEQIEEGYGRGRWRDVASSLGSTPLVDICYLLPHLSCQELRHTDCCLLQKHTSHNRALSTSLTVNTYSKVNSWLLRRVSVYYFPLLLSYSYYSTGNTI